MRRAASSGPRGARVHTRNPCAHRHKRARSGSRRAYFEVQEIPGYAVHLAWCSGSRDKEGSRGSLQSWHTSEERAPPPAGSSAETRLDEGAKRADRPPEVCAKKKSTRNLSLPSFGILVPS